MGDKPLFSAKARGILSNASANARNAYCSSDDIYLEYFKLDFDLENLHFDHFILTLSAS